MKAKAAIVFLVILAAGLGIGLIVRHNNAKDERDIYLAKINNLSNTVVETQASLDEQKTVNLTLLTNVDTLKIEVAGVSNKLTSVSTTLSETEALLKKTQEEAKAAAEKAAQEIAARDSKIAELQGQNDEITKKMVDLNTTIGNLDQQIKDTERKLAASEGEREFLLKELKRLQAEKASLEKKFNDLAVLRDQVRKLKEELSIANRLAWIRSGLYSRVGQKGGELLNRGVNRAPEASTNNQLNVELRQDGSATIQAPAPAAQK